MKFIESYCRFSLVGKIVVINPKKYNTNSDMYHIRIMYKTKSGNGYLTDFLGMVAFDEELLLDLKEYRKGDTILAEGLIREHADKNGDIKTTLVADKIIRLSQAVSDKAIVTAVVPQNDIQLSLFTTNTSVN